MTKELIVVNGKVIEQERGYSAASGRELSYEQGAKMIKRHYDQNPDDVVAHFIGKTLIEQVLSQPSCVGLRVFHGINDSGIRQLIMVGVDSQGKNLVELTQINEVGEYSQLTGKVISEAKKCPPYCGGDTPTSDDSPSGTWW